MKHRKITALETSMPCKDIQKKFQNSCLSQYTVENISRCSGLYPPDKLHTREMIIHHNGGKRIKSLEMWQSKNTLFSARSKAVNSRNRVICIMTRLWAG
jgi:hypothetical protein